MKTQIAEGQEEENTSMGKHGKEEEKKGKERRDNPNKNKEVIITVYVESPSPPPPPIHVHQKGTNKKSKPVSKAGGYDRRAQLLAYSKELRKADTKQPQWPKNTPKLSHKINGKSFSNPVRIQGITRNRKRYWRSVPEVDISCRPKSVVGRKKNKANRQRNSHLRRIKGILRGFCGD